MTTPVAPPAIIVGEGAPLILLHAFPLDGRMWMEQAHALGDSFQVIVPDLRGFGAAHEQARDLDEIPIDLVADDIVELLDERGIEKASIGGSSRGGYIALAIARRNPDRLRSLLLFGTRATPADEKEKQGWTDMKARLRNDGISFVPDHMRQRMFGPTALQRRPELVTQVSEIMLGQNPDAVAAAAGGMSSRPDAVPGLKAIRIPVLAITGVEDKAFESTRAIAQAIPDAQFEAIEQAAHLSNMEQPAQVTNLIRRFLAERAAAG